MIMVAYKITEVIDVFKQTACIPSPLSIVPKF